METKERTNCLRIFILVVDFIKEGLTNLIEFHVTNKGITFEDFINQHQHDIYHHYHNSKCCQCPSGQNYNGHRKRVIYPTQLAVLYDKHGHRWPGHNTRPNDEFCCSKAKPGISEKDLDVTLAKFILMNYCKDVFWHPSKTFEDFLNVHKHDIFHMCRGTSPCCLCIGSYQSPPTVPSFQNEWTNLFSGRFTPCANCLPINLNSVCSFSATLGISETSVTPIIVQQLIEHVSPLGNAVYILTEIRNSEYGHKKEVRITDTDFNLTWSKIKHQLLRISKIYGNTVETQDRLESLKQRTLDETLLGQYQTTLQGELLRNDELKKVVQKVEEVVTYSFKEIHNELKNVAHGLKEVTENKNESELQSNRPRLIVMTENEEKKRKCEEQSKKMIENHEQSGIYVSTRGQQAAIRNLQETGIVVITGPSGAGKSSMGMELLRLHCSTFQTYSAIIPYKVTDWMNIVNINDRVVVFLDDIFGRTNCNYDEDIHSIILSNIDLCIKAGNVKVIVSMRENIRYSCHRLFDRNVLFSKCTVVNLGTEYEMNSEEKLECLFKHCEKNHIQVIDENESLRETLDTIAHVDACKILGFPEACVLFTSVREFTKKGVSFFAGANTILCQEIFEIYKNRHVDYAILVFMLLNGSTMDITIDHLERINLVSKSIYSGVVALTTWDLSQSLDRLKESYLIFLEPNVLTFQHRAIFEAVLLSYKSCDQTEVLTLMDLEFIIEMSRPHDYIVADREVCLIIQRHNYKFVAKKIVAAIYISINPYESVRRLMESPIITCSGSEIIQLIIQVNSEPHSSKSAEKYSFAFNSLVQYLVSSYFELTIALVNFCYEDEQIFMLLKNEISKKLCNTDGIGLRHILVINFFIHCLDGNTVKAGLLLEIMKVNRVFLTNLKTPFEFVFLHSVLRHTNALTVMCKVLGDSHIDSLKFIMNEACNGGFLEAARQLLNVYKSHVFVTDELIENACASGNVDIVQLLLTIFGNESFKAENVLNEACSSKDNTVLVQFLLQTFDHRFLDIKTAFNIACRHGHVQLVNLFIEVFDENMLDLKTAMEEACLSRDYDMLKLVEDTLNYLKEKIDLKMHSLHGNVHFGNFLRNILADCFKYFLTRCSETKILPIDKNTAVFIFDSIMQETENAILNQFFDFETDVDSVYLAAEDMHSMLLKVMKSHTIEELLNNDLVDLVVSVTKNLPFIPVDKRVNIKLFLSCLLHESFFNDISLRIVPILSDKFDHKLFDANSALINACQRKHVDLVRLLLRTFDQNKFDVNSAMEETLRQTKYSSKIIQLLFDKFDYSKIDFNIFKDHFEKICTFGEDKLLTTFFNTIDPSGFDIDSALTTAYWFQNIKAVELLLHFIGNLKSCESTNVKSCIIDETENINIASEFHKQTKFDVNNAVFIAFQFGKEEVVKIILNKSHNNYFVQNMAMIRACSNGQIGLVKFLVETFDQDLLNIKRALQIACRTGAVSVVKYLIDTFENHMFDAEIALNEACKSGKVELVKFVLETFGQSHIDKKTAVIKACKSSNLDLVKFVFKIFGQSLVDANIAINQACRSGNVNVVKFVFDTYGLRHVDTKIAMNGACRSGNVDVVQLILSSFSSCNIDIDNALKESCRSGNVDVVNIVLYHCGLSHVDKSTGINAACRSGVSDILISVLTTFGESYMDKTSAVNEACSSGNIDMVKFLLNTFGHNPVDVKMLIDTACQSGNVPMLKFVLDTFGQSLVEKNSALNAAWKSCDCCMIQFAFKTFGQSLVDFKKFVTESCQSDETLGLELLLDICDHNMFDGDLALNLVCSFNKVKHAKMLTNSIDYSPCVLKSSMNTACAHSSDDIVKFLLSKYDHKILDLREIINQACVNGNISLINLLIEKVDHSILDLQTATITACEKENIQVVKVLLAQYYPTLVELHSIYDAATKTGDIDIATYIYEFSKILYTR